MVIALVVGWVLAGLLLALLVGGAVRVAESHGAWATPGEPYDPELVPTT